MGCTEIISYAAVISYAAALEYCNKLRFWVVYQTRKNFHGNSMIILISFSSFHVSLNLESLNNFEL